ncbi:FAD-dependent oxidoreductase [Lactiplantibacillus pentosus]|uniref:FAD-dependent oxidoreductase n=1 Tax=Lactiplantibacillus pentosus TaxID=1589 RepID=UPI000EA9DC34|nr:FAD-dependent oxidoreductase [Lactiplantibacillus pentosus]AYG38411.1 FAD-dependent oxidoreductase [Lactiplantibacillus pentosus]AYG41071.1 FAD-dependent oxidoreductase [Lactiplantibacillus pentosus]MCJ8181382.1 FAD-dependent oxidoreductase [Lactiplantibacillus pentosus]
MDKSLNDGTYSVVAKGYEGNSTKLKVIVANHRIEQIIPEKDITPNTLEDAVFTQIPEQIINHQTLDVDALTGASYSSQGLLDAVAEVVKQAGGSVAKFRTEEHDTTGSQVKTDSESSEEYGNWIQRPNHIDKKVETDFLIIGAGISGLAAAVQAGEEGIKTTVIEKNSFVAGNGGGVEGIFGINTDMQKAAGIHAEKEEIIAREQELGQYRADGSFWVDLVNHSAENIDWLLKEGVQLTKVDDYHGTCAFPTFHWFKGGFASEGYVPYMKKRADELGIDFILNASADGIIYDGDRVAGAYVTTPKGKLEIDAKATLLATGGVGHNPKLIAKQGWQTKNLHYCSMPSNTGDGYMMAMAVGAKDMLNESAEFMMNYIQALPHEGVHLYIDPINGFMSLPSGGPVMFVNQDGVRLVNENVKKDNLLYQRMAIKSTKVTYEVFNQKVYDSITQGVDNADQILADAVKRNEGHSLYKADTFDQLVKAVGLPEATFVDTVKRYNQYAINGKDEEFNKDPEMLVTLDEGPYYIARLDPSNLIGIGGVASNRQFEVIKDDYEKVPGLYVSGMDSTMQYRSVYTITLGGSACAHNVNSGRHAAMNAKKYMASLKS